MTKTAGETSYIFWVADWGVAPVYTAMIWRPLYVPCLISAQGLTIQLPRPLHLTYNHIVSCERYVFSQGLPAGSTVNVKITLVPSAKITKDNITSNIIYLALVNPLLLPGTKECDDMVTIITSYQLALHPAIHKNPYYRELKRRGREAEFSEERWQAHVLPHVYTKPQSLRQTLWQALITLGVLLAFLVAVGIIYNLLY